MANRAIAISVIATLTTAPALAADMALKAPPPVVAPVPVYSWTSCYIGGFGGGLWAHKDWTDVTPGGPNGDSGSHSVDGAIGGGQIGCDYQTPNRFVFGIQGSFGGTDARGSNINQLAPAIIDRTQIDSLATVTGRIGYSWDRFLAYIKGGAAWERDNYTLTLVATGAPFSTASETRSGYTLGVGTEYAFTDCISAFAEYDYYGFGTRTLTFPSAAPDLYAIRENKSVGLVGLDFRWGQRGCGYTAPAPAALVTK